MVQFHVLCWSGGGHCAVNAWASVTPRQHIQGTLALIMEIKIFNLNEHIIEDRQNAYIYFDLNQYASATFVLILMGLGHIIHSVHFTVRYNTYMEASLSMYRVVTIYG